VREEMLKSGFFGKMMKMFTDATYRNSYKVVSDFDVRQTHIKSTTAALGRTVAAAEAK
jgi:hypothetical protein